MKMSVRNKAIAYIAGATILGGAAGYEAFQAVGKGFAMLHESGLQDLKDLRSQGTATYNVNAISFDRDHGFRNLPVAQSVDEHIALKEAMIAEKKEMAQSGAKNTLVILFGASLAGVLAFAKKRDQGAFAKPMAPQSVPVND